MIMVATCKLGENGCWNDGKCRATSNCENKIKTNADRILAMSDEELAEFLESTHTNMAIKLGGEYIVRAKEYIEIWLKQLAE
jgi:hypothetical protein